MPHIRVRAVEAVHVQKLSETLPVPLAEAMGTTTDNFTFELIHTQYFQDGKGSNGYPFVEVLWFARDKDAQQKSATIITDRLKELTGAQDIAVIFIPIQKNEYFENGRSFA